jgi:hypothetical protein
MKNVRQKLQGESNTHFMFSDFFSENCAIYEIMWKNTAQLNRLQMTMWPMHLAGEFKV